MHVIDAVLKSFSNLFRSHSYSLEKLYSLFLLAKCLFGHYMMVVEFIFMDFMTVRNAI